VGEGAREEGAPGAQRYKNECVIHDVQVKLCYCEWFIMAVVAVVGGDRQRCRKRLQCASYWSGQTERIE
jgi:hypothetical protein